MEGNKDEALRCIGIAKDAISAGNKVKALKFIRIARRLNENLSVDDLLASCENLDSSSAAAAGTSSKISNGTVGPGDRDSVSNGERGYTEEHVQLVRQIKSKKDYYTILGLERNCSVEEVRKAYRKLSLKVHPDKNNAPGSEEAFKKVSKAFQCLSNDDSRRQYDQTGLVDEFEHDQQYPARRRSRRAGNDFFDDHFDPDEIFRAFFGQGDSIFRTAHVYRTRAQTGGGDHQRENSNSGGPNLMLLIQLLPFLIIILLAYLPFSEPQYSLQRNYSYQYKQMTEEHGVEFFVKTSDFEDHFPIGSPGRQEIENNVINDYKSVLGRHCHMEMQRRQWNRNFRTPHCDKLETFYA